VPRCGKHWAADEGEEGEGEGGSGSAGVGTMFSRARDSFAVDVELPEVKTVSAPGCYSPPLQPQVIKYNGTVQYTTLHCITLHYTWGSLVLVAAVLKAPLCGLLGC